MTSRLGIAVAVCWCVASVASAQSVVRFETTMGNFDMVLNPTNNSILQNHVDNMLEYVNRETYTGTWINRAASGFVLQMGGFYSQTLLPQFSFDQVRNIRSFAPIQGHPAADNPPLSNTVGTVALALSGGANGTNQNSGSSSFFVNMTSNTFLDADFTVFAAIPDMTTINNIMALSTIDRTTAAKSRSCVTFAPFRGRPHSIGLRSSGNLIVTSRHTSADAPPRRARRAAGLCPRLTCRLW